MANTLHKILSEKYWSARPESEKKKLLELFFIWTVAGVAAVIYLIYNLIFKFGEACILCNIFLVTITVLGIICILNGKINFALNLIFSVPLIVYSYFISDFNLHPTENGTMYLTVFWLFFGLLYLILFSETNRTIITYFIIGELTLVFQLQKSNLVTDSFETFQPIVIHPLVLFAIIFLGSVLLRNYYLNIIKKQEQQIRTLNNGITKVVQGTPFSIAQIKAERDEAGNIIHFIIDKVNHSFEANFKINLYEVQEQKADYIFNLIFKNKFDLNKIILSGLKKQQEFYAANFDRWYSIHVLQPEYNRFFLIFEDISKTKSKIAELEANKQHYKVLLEAIPDMLFVIDKDGTYEDFVIKENDLFKIEDTNIVGSSIFEVGFPDNLANKMYSCIQNSIKTNSVETIEYSMNTPNGTFLFEMRLAKLNSHAVICVARDITKRKSS